jgi:hypothetical protein
MAKPFDPLAEGATPFDPLAQGATPVNASGPDGDEELKTIARNIAKVLFGASPGGYVAMNAPAIGRGAIGMSEPEGASLTDQAANLTGSAGVIAAPTAALGGLAAKGAAGVLQRGALAGVTTGGQKAVRDIAGGSAPEDIASEAGKSAAASVGIEAFFGAAGKAFRFAKPSLVRLGSQLMRSTSAVPEKYGKAVLENPAILTEAPSMKAASAMYKRAVNGMKGAREFLADESKTGDLLASNTDLESLINKANKGLAEKNLGLQQALAARQATSNLLEMAKFGDPRQRANKAALIGLKEQLDEYLETGLPGFRQATRGYFDANAREAFRSILPQNKNLSANALRGLGGLSLLSAGAIMKAPFVLAGAAAFSPRATGLMIRGGKSVADLMASQSAQFAARVGAIKAVEGQ